MGRADYRDYIFPPEHPRLSLLRHHDRHEHMANLRASKAFKPIIDAQARLLDEPLVGITTDGVVRQGLYRLRDDGAPVEATVAAAGHLLGLLNAEQCAILCLPLDSNQWRAWNNGQANFFEHGLRLEEQPLHIRDAMLAVVAASLSQEGYRTTRHVMWVNEFLGELIDSPRLFNEWSYNFTLFGEVSTVEPWGWQLMGHHLSLNCVLLGGQMILSPTFIGMEPAYMEDGPYAGVAGLIELELGGQELMRSLRASVRERAVIYEQMRDPKMPPGRVHPTDQLQLLGSLQDNRVIPYEGVPVADFSGPERRKVLELIDVWLEPLPRGPRSARLAEIEQYLDEAHLCWIGPVEEEQPFYYRIQSPVIGIEFDHHSGVLFSNEEPMTFHIHTLMRTPNGNDYGADLLRQHYQAHDHGSASHTHGPMPEATTSEA